jgi:hypothetical protein
MANQILSYPDNNSLKLFASKSALLCVEMGGQSNRKAFTKDILIAKLLTKKPVNDLQAERLLGMNKNPDEYRAIGDWLLSAPVRRWLLSAIETLTPELEEKAAQKWADEAPQRAERAAADAADKILADVANGEAATLRQKIPADHVEVTVTNVNEAMPDMDCEGVSLDFRDCKKIGTAHARRPNALGAFLTIPVVSISREKLNELKAKMDTKEQQNQVYNQEKTNQSSQAVPDDAVAAYIACGGNYESLSDDIDNPDYWLVKKWSEAIEHQNLAPSQTKAKLIYQFNQSVREQDHGIQG